MCAGRVSRKRREARRSCCAGEGGWRRGQCRYDRPDSRKEKDRKGGGKRRTAAACPPFSPVPLPLLKPLRIFPVMLEIELSISVGTSLTSTARASMTFARRSRSGRSREVMRRGRSCILRRQVSPGSVSEREREGKEAHFRQLSQSKLLREVLEEGREGDEVYRLSVGVTGCVLVGEDELGKEEGEEALLVEELRRIPCELMLRETKGGERTRMTAPFSLLSTPSLSSAMTPRPVAACLPSFSSEKRSSSCSTKT